MNRRDRKTKKAVEQEVQELIDRNERPPVSEVRSVRRRAAAIPELDDLAEWLMELEQAIDSEDQSFEDLVEELGEKSESRQQIQLSMAQREPFPELRYDVLKQWVGEHGGDVVHGDGRTVTVSIPFDSSERLEGLYHWNIVDG